MFRIRLLVVVVTPAAAAAVVLLLLLRVVAKGSRSDHNCDDVGRDPRLD